MPYNYTKNKWNADKYTFDVETTKNYIDEKGRSVQTGLGCVLFTISQDYFIKHDEIKTKEELKEEVKEFDEGGCRVMNEELLAHAMRDNEVESINISTIHGTDEEKDLMYAKLNEIKEKYKNSDTSK